MNGGSPASRAGLRGGTKDADVLGRTVTTGGDVIVAIDGRPVQRADDVVRFVVLLAQAEGRRVFTIVAGEQHKVAVTLDEATLPRVRLELRGISAEEQTKLPAGLGRFS